MRTFMSHMNYETIHARLTGGPLAAMREARRILAETEPALSDWWRQPAWDVRPLRITGLPERCQITLSDMPAWSALADALRAFVGEGE